MQTQYIGSSRHSKHISYDTFLNNYLNNYINYQNTLLIESCKHNETYINTQQ